MQVTLSKLYVVVDRSTLDARGVQLRAFAEELREAGVRLVQYRDKVGAPQEVLRGAREVAEVFDGVEAMLVLNDRADLAALLGWGVHVGQGDLSAGDVRALTQSSRSLTPSFATAVVGVSTHTEEHMKVADATVADYVAVGPVFATVTKRDAEPVVGLEGVRRARALTRLFPERRALVAIGGITLENCRSVIEAGSDAVAVISGLFVPGRTVRAVAEDFLERMR